ncbi:plant cysteine oxidase 4-like isoform X2 [Nymphaea colorata]|uniref:plant cysteine oxidase 4-like isoform X2 n=1 Tax=Nymphaea colorata TaxID=210225 RepID=UPI00129ED725|nr:plant cysteine oxidase 4-like isoform X2 [Nymphaea colorata]
MTLCISMCVVRSKQAMKHTGTSVHNCANMHYNMRASDLGLREDMRYFRVNVPELSPFVTIMPIYACDKFSICIFCLPPAAFIPLHNHPGMTVFSKLLFGSMHIKSYDWVTNIPNGSDPESQPNFQGVASMASSVGPRLAKVHFDGIFTAESDTSVLYPTTGVTCTLSGQLRRVQFLMSLVHHTRNLMAETAHITAVCHVQEPQVKAHWPQGESMSCWRRYRCLMIFPLFLHLTEVQE